jgi:hypothetical protein
MQVGACNAPTVWMPLCCWWMTAISNYSPSPQRLLPVFAAQKYAEHYRLADDAGTNTGGSRQGVWRISSLRIMVAMQRGKRIVGDPARPSINY